MMIRKKYDCNYSKFDIEKHNKHYINYCEVCITPDGVIHYAHPSHQMFMSNYIMKKYKVKYNELENMIPMEYSFDVLNWLTMKSKCVCVWYDVYKGVPNKKQRLALKKLSENHCVGFSVPASRRV